MVGNQTAPDGVNQRDVLLHDAELHGELMFRKPQMLMAHGALSGAFAINMSLGDQILARLKEMRMTQAALAREIGGSPQQVHNYIKNTRTPDEMTLAKIAAALRIDPADLSGRRESLEKTLRVVLARLFDLAGVPQPKATVLVEAAIEALRLHATLDAESDALTRARLAAQAAWNAQPKARRSE